VTIVDFQPQNVKSAGALSLRPLRPLRLKALALTKCRHPAPTTEENFRLETEKFFHRGGVAGVNRRPLRKDGNQAHKYNKSI
jgi:hypothetical protein